MKKYYRIIIVLCLMAKVILGITYLQNSDSGERIKGEKIGMMKQDHEKFSSSLMTNIVYAADPIAEKKPVGISLNKDKKDLEKEINLIKELTARKNELDKREETIKKKEEELKQLEQELGNLYKKYADMGKAIEQKVGKLEVVNDEKYKQLIKLFESMPAEEAASRIQKMNTQMAIKIFVGMKGKVAGKILGMIEPASAVKISEQLVGLNSFDAIGAESNDILP